MTLRPSLLKHKTLMLAVVLLAQKIAQQMDFDLQAPISEICRTLEANRTSVYEQAQRLLKELARLARAQPGRPPKPACAQPPSTAELELTCKVQDYRLRHPGAVVQAQGQRTRYAPAFRRFLLQLGDTWKGTEQAFAQAARLPLDTWRDWRQKDRKDALPKPMEKPHASKVPSKVPPDSVRFSEKSPGK